MPDRRIEDFATLPEANSEDLLLVCSENETYNIKFGTLQGAVRADSEGALAAAKAAQEHAESAASKVGLAEHSAEMAWQNATRAEEKAETAQAAAESAQQRADASANSSQTAEEKATNAEASAEIAKNAAVAAKEIADGVKTATEQALSAAEQARTEAENASAKASEAETAISNANAATASATSAKENADRATVAANEAASTAEAAASAVENAINTAVEKTNEAVSKAESAADSAEQAISQSTEATRNAITATEAANTAATTANETAERLQNATESVESAVNAATEAVQNAVAATQNAETATESANLATEKTKVAITQALNLNISAEQISEKEATISITDKNGLTKTVQIGGSSTSTAVEGWENIQAVVRSGLGPMFFPIGYEFEVQNSETGETITWVVRAHDHHKAADSDLQHTMTLESKYAIEARSFSGKCALYYAATQLNAGQYTIKLSDSFGSISSGTYYFTTTKSIPAGGIIGITQPSSSGNITNCLAFTRNANMDLLDSGLKISKSVLGTTYGTKLGTISNHGSGGDSNLCCINRIFSGSNNYAQGCFRFWLNGNKNLGTIRPRQTKFDSPTSWPDSQSDGFLYGMPQDFLDVVQPAIVPCHTNGIFEVNSLDGTVFNSYPVENYTLTDKFFLLSQSEIYGTYQNSSCNDGTQLEYYQNLSDAEKIIYTEAGAPSMRWTRTPSYGSSNGVIVSNSNGTVLSANPVNSTRVCPACVIA